ncbi:MAG: hypothetical protein J3K34DRAFT_455439 [Monoraphidium minutum]|nr:MAG: hypothetical protein J3K34DRAFT_455439 [Monoraphidium minutum]
MSLDRSFYHPVTFRQNARSLSCPTVGVESPIGYTAPVNDPVRSRLAAGRTRCERAGLLLLPARRRRARKQRLIASGAAGAASMQRQVSRVLQRAALLRSPCALEGAGGAAGPAACCGTACEGGCCHSCSALLPAAAHPWSATAGGRGYAAAAGGGSGRAAYAAAPRSDRDVAAGGGRGGGGRGLSGGGGAEGGGPREWPGKRPRQQGPTRGDDLLLRVQAAPSLLDLEDLLDANLRSLTYIHLGAASLRAAKLAERGGGGGGGAPGGAEPADGAPGAGPRAARQLLRVMRQLESLHERAMPLLPARPLAHLLYAAAKAGHAPGERLLLAAARHLAGGGGARLAAASGADLAQLSWGLARAGAWMPELQLAIDEVRRAHTTARQGLRFYIAIMPAVAARAPEMDMRAVSMLLTAAHLARNTDAAPLGALAARALELAPGAPPLLLARVAHALVKLAHPSDPVLQGIAVALLPRLAELDDSSLMLVLGSYKIAGHQSAAALNAAALPLLLARAPGLAPPLLARAAQVFGPLGRTAFAVAGGGGGAEAGGAAAAGGGGGGGPGGVVREDVERLLAAVDAAAVARLQHFRPGDLRSLVWHLRDRASPELAAAARAAAAAADAEATRAAAAQAAPPAANEEA